MRSLLDFLIKYSNFLLFLLLETIALILLFTYDDMHQSVAFTSANKVNGKIYTLRNNITGYFLLRKNNEELLRQNSDLQLKVSRLEESLRQAGIQEQALKPALDYDYIHAKVIKNSVTQMCNYITVDVGSSDGVEKGMGVSNQSGIVGVVAACSEHYAIIVSVLNAKISFSCKIANSSAIGSLSWHGGDLHTANLEEMPGYVLWENGDTVITSGFSDAFPEGVPVGIIESSEKKGSDNFYTSKVRLFTQFEALSDVRIYNRILRKEQLLLEQEETK